MKQEHMTAAEYREEMAKPRKNKTLKYRNQPTPAGGRMWPSKKQADYYNQLVLMKRAGEIIDFLAEVDFIIYDGYYRDVAKDKMQWVRPIKYRADFVVIRKKHEGILPQGLDFVVMEIHEVKGKWTKLAEAKRKMFESRYPEYEFKVI